MASRRLNNRLLETIAPRVFGSINNSLSVCDRPTVAIGRPIIKLLLLLLRGCVCVRVCGMALFGFVGRIRYNTRIQVYDKPISECCRMILDDRLRFVEKF